MTDNYHVITGDEITDQSENACPTCQHTKEQLAHMREQLCSIKNAIHLLETNVDLIESNFHPATEDSIIVENTKDGYIIKKIPSILGSYVIMDGNKKLDQLSQKEQSAIKAQNDFHKYKNTVDTGKGIIDTYSIFSVVVSMGKWFTPIL